MADTPKDLIGLVEFQHAHGKSTIFACESLGIWWTCWITLGPDHHPIASNWEKLEPHGT